jgi:glycosyltransferase involved in cell wall biosynthesis
MSEHASKPKRLALILPHLGLGGAQRVAVILANHWAEQGLDVHIVTTLEHKEDFYELAPLIKRRILRKTPKNDGSEVLEQLGAKGGSFLTKANAYLEERLANLRRARTSSDDVGSPSKRGRSPPLQVAKRIIAVGGQIFTSNDPKLILAVLIILPARILRKSAKFVSRRFRQGLKDISSYCINNQALGRNPKPYLSLIRASMWRVPALRQVLDEIEPDVVLSFLGATNIMTIASTRGLSLRVVISERNDPGRQELDKPWQSLRPLIYPVADVVTANSHGAVEHMQAYCSTAKLAYVPNPIVIPDNVSQRRTNSVLFLARLVHQKAPDVLIDAFARFAEGNRDWSLQIAGDGPMQAELMERVRNHGIADRVVFHGMVKDPTDLLASSRVFVLPSRFEGTPNSLLGVSGLVVKTENVQSLAAALHQLAKNAELRSRLAEAAWERTSIHRLKNVVQTWERLLFI